MKHTFKFILGALAMAVVVLSCKKDENRITLESGTSPVLTASRTGSVPLSFANKDQEAIKLSWTNPNYKFTTGTSSHNVTYLLEIDTAGSNFKNANRKVISLSGDLGLSITQHDFNDYLLSQMRLTAGRTYNLEIRVTSTIAGNAASLPSNVLKLAATPYAIPPKVAPPASGELFIVGNATPGGDATGWNNPVPVPSQKFTKVSNTFYTITIALNAGKSYLFLPVNGSWNEKFGFDGGNNANDPNSFDFRNGGGDMKAPATNGTYRIDVDFQLGKVTVTKL